MKRNLVIFLVLVFAIFLAGCAYQPPPVEVDNPPGFFYGLFQGFTCLFSLIGSIFWDVRIYAFPNSGFWYDAGYVLGVACFFGGSTGTACKR